MRALVVGANGDVGSRTCAALRGLGADVRGSVRRRARGASLERIGVELVEADLASPRDWPAALAGVDVVVLTANAVAPRKGDDPRAVEAGLVRFVDDARGTGVSRIVLASIPVSSLDERIPFAKARRELEECVVGAGPEAAVVRFPPFMGAWLALVGSSIPLRGSPHATIGRPSPFLRTFRRRTSTLVERRGVMLVPGSPAHRNAFIAEDDVATELAHAAVRPEVPAAPVEVGGPEVLSWREVAAVYADLLGRRVRVLSTPAAAYVGLRWLVRPAGVVPADTMALNRYVASIETPWPPGGGVLAPESMTTVREFLAARLELPEELPTVP